ncbi:MAG: PaaI family thioesterase [Tenacibaculum sp.]|nr:PaaI family thioesterase [Tenacibaculum sp.]
MRSKEEILKAFNEAYATNNKEGMLDALNESNKNTLMETLKMEYVDMGKDFLTMKMTVSSDVHQPNGILHGGATAALCETVAGMASIFSVDTKTKEVKGIELSVNHLKSKEEGHVFATATAIHKGRTTHLWEVRVTDEEGALISLAKMTNIVLDKK